MSTVKFCLKRKSVQLKIKNTHVEKNEKVRLNTETFVSVKKIYISNPLLSTCNMVMAVQYKRLTKNINIDVYDSILS
jgi:hypothetical protein